eukprot:Pompholyxophrys_sp_v1_NODE_80_length_2275_cov_8.699550.p2 type:complete len:115 gc:universal NODE_80_length_2275_cov_8.699550:1738-1394(-)
MRSVCTSVHPIEVVFSPFRWRAFGAFSIWIDSVRIPVALYTGVLGRSAEQAIYQAFQLEVGVVKAGISANQFHELRLLKHGVDCLGSFFGISAAQHKQCFNRVGHSLRSFCDLF